MVYPLNGDENLIDEEDSEDLLIEEDGKEIAMPFEDDEGEEEDSL